MKRIEMKDNPITASIDWLIHQGFNTIEATNICKAIRAETAEKLLEDAPSWIEWCGKVKMDHDSIVMLAAEGLTTVRIGPGGVENDLYISLLEKSIENQTTPPPYGTLAGELPKKSLNEISQQLDDMHHTLACGSCKKLDIEALRWAYECLHVNRYYLFGHNAAGRHEMLDRLKAMLEVE